MALSVPAGRTARSWSSLVLLAGAIGVGLLQPSDLHARWAIQETVIHGSVVDGVRGSPVRSALVRVDGLVRATTDTEGNFRLEAGSEAATMRVEAPGYRVWESRIEAAASPLRIRLEADPFRVAALEVRSRATGRASSLQPAAIVDARQLAERMATSVAAAVVSEPGVTMRTNGPMASQPVIRGLAGDRVMVLEDGLRTGDIATTAPDHAVSIEPATARQIDVIRGPAGLLYGSNTLGGVINVRREGVPRERPDRVEWSAASYGESVNRGGSLAGWARAGMGPWVVQGDGAVRRSSDTRTPGGVPLPNTDLRVEDGGFGLSLVGDQGMLGGAVRGYQASYGVPSSFQGLTLPGSHDGGVYVDVHRLAGRVDGEWTPRAGEWVQGVTGGVNAIRFKQWEYEQGGFVGTRFGQLAAGGDLVVRLQGGGHRGALGTSIQWKDLRAEGSFTGTRPAQHRALAVFAVDEVELGPVQVLGGLRLDRIDLIPLDSTETLLVRDVRTRSFSAATGAVGLRAHLGAGWIGSVQVARAFRPPSIEELFSAGPHLASYAYEVGNPSLEAERGTGIDVFLEHAGPRSRVQLSAFVMSLDGYVLFAPVLDEETGLLLRDPRLRRYVVYAPEQTDARLTGMELRVQLLPLENWGVDLAADMVRGRASGGELLSNIPPASGRIEFRYLGREGTAALFLEGRRPHRATPAPPAGAEATCEPRSMDGEVVVLPSHFCPTDGMLLVGATLSRTLPTAWTAWETRITLGVDNLLDTTWRDPLWRAKEVAPQPGRNLRLAVQVAP